MAVGLQWGWTETPLHSVKLIRVFESHPHRELASLVAVYHLSPSRGALGHHSLRDVQGVRHHWASSAGKVATGLPGSPQEISRRGCGARAWWKRRRRCPRRDEPRSTKRDSERTAETTEHDEVPSRREETYREAAARQNGVDTSGLGFFEKHQEATCGHEGKQGQTQRRDLAMGCRRCGQGESMLHSRERPQKVHLQIVPPRRC